MRVPAARRAHVDWTITFWRQKRKTTAVLFVFCLGLAVPLFVYGAATTLGLSSPFEQIHWAAAARFWARSSHQQFAEKGATARGMEGLLDLSKASAEELRQLISSNTTLTPEQQLHRSAWSLANAVQQGRNLSMEELETVVERFSQMLSNRSYYDKDSAEFIAEQEQLIMSNAPPSWLPKLMQESNLQPPDLDSLEDTMNASPETGPAKDIEDDSLGVDAAEGANNRDLDLGFSRAEISQDRPLTIDPAGASDRSYLDSVTAGMSAGLDAAEDMPEQSNRNTPAGRRLKADSNSAWAMHDSHIRPVLLIL